MERLHQFLNYFRERTGAEPQDIRLTLPEDVHPGVKAIDGVTVERGPFGIEVKADEVKVLPEEESEKPAKATAKAKKGGAK